MIGTQHQSMTQRDTFSRLRARLVQHQILLRYGLIGGAAALIDVGLFVALFTFGGTTELVAHSLSVSAAVLFSFTLNARHNFKTTDRTALRFVSFVIVCLIGFLVGYGIIMLVSAGMADPIRGGNIGKLVSLPVVFILQYVLNSLITFRSGQAS